MEKIIDKFNVFTEKPVKFLTVQNDLKDDIKNLVKSLYDYTKVHEKSEKKQKKGALPELIVQDFDEEQIWQEIELQNNECWDELVSEVANCMTIKDDLKFPVTLAKDQVDEDQDEIDVGESPPVSQKKVKGLQQNKKQVDMGTKPKTFKNKKDKSKPKVKPSIVDDKFFKLQEMEQFLLKEEKNDSKKVPEDSDEESIDLFEEIYSEGEEEEGEGARDVKYSAFFDEGDQENKQDQSSDDELDYNVLDQDDDFDESLHDENDIEDDVQNGVEETKPPKKGNKKVRFAEEGLTDESESDINNEVTDNKQNTNEKKSEFELRQDRLKSTIERLEAKTLKDAPWQLKGEVDAAKRPQNSLLEEVVDFDLTSRPAPLITELTTLTLEDIIRQRIKDKAWDDVQKKEKPVDDQLDFRKTEILDHSKSKLSLAQVYEAEYLKQKQASSGDVEDEKEPEAHTQIRDGMRQLFAKLDALCHYHYTPKAAHAEVRIVSNTPAISMEEVAPVATSEATLLAPEEVKRKSKGELMTKEERNQTDKNRERRKKKKLQRSKGGQVTKITDHRNTKKGIEANDKSLKTSKAFFQQLNDEASSLIKSKNKNVKFGKNKG